MHKIRLVTLLCFVALHGYAQKEKIKLYLTPSKAHETLEKSAAQMEILLEKETGIDIEAEVPASYEELVSKFAGDKPCFGLLNSQSYVLANEKYGAKAKLRIIRDGTSLYNGMIVVKAGSGIKSLADLNGKTLAYTNELSTSGYLYPKKLLERKGVKPGKTIFLQSHEEVIIQVYNGKVDAGAAFYSPESTQGVMRDARARVQSKYPDVAKKVIILAKTESIPSDPFTFSKNMHPDVVLKLTVALIRIAATPEGKKLLKDMYDIDGLVRASDGDYETLRAVIAGR